MRTCRGIFERAEEFESAILAKSVGRIDRVSRCPARHRCQLADANRITARAIALTARAAQTHPAAATPARTCGGRGYLRSIAMVGWSAPRSSTFTSALPRSPPAHWTVMVKRPSGNSTESKIGRFSRLLNDTDQSS